MIVVDVWQRPVGLLQASRVAWSAGITGRDLSDSQADSPRHRRAPKGSLAHQLKRMF